MNISPLQLRPIKLMALAAMLLVLAGCITVSDKQAIIENTSAYNFASKRVAVLPVKAQTSLAPDSVLALRNEINKLLAQSLRGKLTSSTVLDVTAVANLLNQNDELQALEQLVSTYENTGVIDRRQINKLGQLLKSEYLVFSRLKSEKMDMFILGKGMGASLETMIIDASTGEIAWSGSGEWKRGGIFGLGGAAASEAANQLVALSLSTLPQASGSAPVSPATGASLVVDEPKEPAPKKTKKAGKKRKK